MFAQMQNRAMLEFALKQAIWQLKSQYPKSLTLGKLFPETLVATRDACSPRITPAMTVAGLMINCDEDGVGYGPELSAMFPETKTYNQVAMGYGTPIYLFWAVLSVILNDPSGSAEDFAAAKLRKVPQYAHLADEAQQYLDELVRQGLGYLISSFKRDDGITARNYMQRFIDDFASAREVPAAFRLGTIISRDTMGLYVASIQQVYPNTWEREGGSRR